MRVLWVAHAHHPDSGGIATHGRLLAPALRAAGVDLHVWSLRDREEEVVLDGVPVRRFKTGVHVTHNDGRGVLRDRATFARLLDELEPDVVHAHGPDPMVGLVQTLPRVRQGPSVFTLHSPHTMADRGEGVLRLLHDADVVVAVSQRQRATLLEAAPALATKTVALPNCVPEHPPAGPPPSSPVVLAGGRLSHQKAIDVLLDAWALVHQRRPDARLVVVGDGELAAELHDQQRRLGLQDVVRFVGHQGPDEVRRWLADTRFLVMPSRYEGMPYFALEAAMSGRPVVGTAVGGLDEAVVDGETGVLVPPEAPAPLAGAVVALLDDPDRAADLGGRARERVLAQHGLDEALQALLAVYRRALTPTPRPHVVSVVVPARRAERWIGEAVGSARAQALPEGHQVEVVVVDDGSDDATAATARAAGADVVVRQCPSRAGGARNTGMALATGELVAFLDADDRWPVERTVRLLEPLQGDPDLQAAFGDAEEFGEGDGVLARPERLVTRMPNTALFRRSAVERVGGWLMDRTGEAIDWMARFLEADPPVAHVEVVAVERRVHGDNTGRGVQAQRNRLASLKQHLDRQRTKQNPNPNP